MTRGASPPITPDGASMSHPGRHVVDRAGQVRQKPARGLEGLFLGVDSMIDGAAAKLDCPAAEFLFGAWFAQPLHDRGPGDKHGGNFFIAGI